MILVWEVKPLKKKTQILFFLWTGYAKITTSHYTNTTACLTQSNLLTSFSSSQGPEWQKTQMPKLILLQC